MNPEVDAYLLSGCGRCPLHDTPDCKVHLWTQEMRLLRQILLDSGLNEERKWGVACYTHRGKNLAILGAFKQFCSISFFKGVLLKDEAKILSAAGENSQSARLVKITSVDQVLRLTSILRDTIQEAIAVEESGEKVPFKAIEEHDVPQELAEALEEDPNLKAAFEALTPGRRRGYMIFIGGAKQSLTRKARVGKSIPGIMSGKGIHD